ncbi:MAG TPA: hypothetical protein VFA46_22410 [Actinomycetes bacterium]|nr:hypothetical protein [Actinomycetes bacterium]
MDQLVPELLLALGGALLLGNLAAYMRLRSAWREAKQAGRSRADKGGGASSAKPAGPNAAGAKAAGGKAAGSKAATLPSRTRVLANVVVGLVVTVASLAALIARG